MPENQYIEYKQSWHDDHLKWGCGFANATVGVSEAKEVNTYSIIPTNSIKICIFNNIYCEKLVIN